MDLKTLGVSAAVASAAMVSAVGVVLPAQALRIGGVPNYNPLSSLPTTLEVTGEFNDGDLTGGFTDVSSILVGQVTIKSGSSIAGFNASYDPTPNFLTNFKYLGVNAVLNLLGGNEVFHTITPIGPRTLVSTVDFNFIGEIRALAGGRLLGKAIGGFSANRTVNGSTTTSSNFSLDLTASPIPTPVLLPGLLALGAGVLRKGKDEVAEEGSEA